MYIYKADDYLRRNMSVHISENITTKSEAVHRHDFAELVYISDGKAAEYVGDTMFYVQRGDLVFINYGSTHAFTPKGELTYINIIFKPEYLSSAETDEENTFRLLSLTAFGELQTAAKRDGVVVFSGDERAELEMLLRGMLREYAAAQQGYATVLNGYLSVLITKAMRKLCIGCEPNAAGNVWQQLLRYINDNYNRKLTLSELANRCFYNPSYFSRVFKEKFGVTAVEYINSCRVKAAAELLSEQSLTMQQIAEHCGFGDKTAFYRCFQKAYGCTPGEFKKSKNMQPLK